MKKIVLLTLILIVGPMIAWAFGGVGEEQLSTMSLNSNLERSLHFGEGKREILKLHDLEHTVKSGQYLIETFPEEPTLIADAKSDREDKIRGKVPQVADPCSVFPDHPVCKKKEKKGKGSKPPIIQN